MYSIIAVNTQLGGISESLVFLYFIIGFIGLGVALNKLGGSVYWLWLQWRNRESR